MKRPRLVLLLTALCVALHEMLVRVMAHGHVAHVLLGAGNGLPPLEAAMTAALLVVVRFVTVVVLPGVVLAACVELVARELAPSSVRGGPEQGSP